MRVCLPVCLPIYLSVCLSLKSEQTNWKYVRMKPPTTNTTTHTHTLQAVPYSLRHSHDTSNTHTHTHTRAHIVVSDYISDRSRMSQTCMKHFTGGPDHCSWDARFVVLSSLRPRVCQGCQQSELMLSYWWMIISTNDFTSKAHRWNWRYIWILLPLTTTGILTPFSQCYHGKRC